MAGKRDLRRIKQDLREARARSPEQFRRMCEQINSMPGYAVFVNHDTDDVDVVYDAPPGTAVEVSDDPESKMLEAQAMIVAKFMQSELDDDSKSAMMERYLEEFARAKSMFMENMPAIPTREKLNEAKQRMLEYEQVRRGLTIPAHPWINDRSDWSKPKPPPPREQSEEDSLFEIPDEEDTLRALNLELNEDLQESESEQREEQDDEADRIR